MNPKEELNKRIQKENWQPNYRAFPQQILEMEIAWADKDRDRINAKRDFLYLELGRRIIGEGIDTSMLDFPGFEVINQSREPDTL